MDGGGGEINLINPNQIRHPPLTPFQTHRTKPSAPQYPKSATTGKKSTSSCPTAPSSPSKVEVAKSSAPSAVNPGLKNSSTNPNSKAEKVETNLGEMLKSRRSLRRILVLFGIGKKKKGGNPTCQTTVHQWVHQVPVKGAQAQAAPTTTKPRPATREKEGREYLGARRRYERSEKRSDELGIR